MGIKKMSYVSKTCVHWTPYPLETDGGVRYRQNARYPEGGIELGLGARLRIHILS